MKKFEEIAPWDIFDGFDALEFRVNVELLPKLLIKAPLAPKMCMAAYKINEGSYAEAARQAAAEEAEEFAIEAAMSEDGTRTKDRTRHIRWIRTEKAKKNLRSKVSTYGSVRTTYNGKGVKHVGDPSYKATDWRKAELRKERHAGKAECFKWQEEHPEEFVKGNALHFPERSDGTVDVEKYINHQWRYNGDDYTVDSSKRETVESVYKQIDSAKYPGMIYVTSESKTQYSKDEETVCLGFHANADSAIETARQWYSTHHIYENNRVFSRGINEVGIIASL